LGEAAHVPLPGCTIREWGEGAITELVKFFHNKFLTLDAFALAAERSILSDCLAAAMFKPSELLSGPTDIE